MQALVVEILHFLVKAPSLRHLRQIRINFLSEDFPLHVDDLPGQVLADGRAAVIFRAQAHGEDALKILVAPDPFPPELLEHGLLRGCGIVPIANGPSVIGAPVPFLLRAEHRLLMAGAHDDAVFVRQPGVFRIVFIEAVVPHGGPEVVASKTQNQLEQIGVKAAPVIGRRRAAAHRNRAVFLPHPSGQVRTFIIQKKAPILDRRRPLHNPARLHKQGVLVLHRHVRPPVPGRDADLFAKLINAENGPAFIAPGNHQRATAEVGGRIWHDLDEKRLPLALDAGDINLVVADQPVNYSIFANRADDDGPRHPRALREARVRRHAGYARHILPQIFGRPQDAGEIRGIHHESRLAVILDDGETVLGIVGFDKRRKSEGKAPGKK